MNYILTQSHPSRGFQGLVVDSDIYLATPYYDRPLYEVLNESTEQWYWARLEARMDEKCSLYLLIDQHAAGKILNDFNWGAYESFVCNELKKGNRASLSFSDNECLTFYPIIS